MEIKNLLSAADLSGKEVVSILDVADALQKRAKESNIPPLLRGRALALVFDETSLRTRAAFQRAMEDLGGQAHVYSGAEIRLGRNAKKQEHLPDLANVIGSFYDGVLSRIYDHDLQLRFAELLPVPFINGMCNAHHPTQALCDLLTIRRRFGKLDGVKIAFVGDATNVALSVAQLSSKVGINFVIACPASVTFPGGDDQALGIKRICDPIEAVNSADVVIADTWVPMGLDAERAARCQLLEPYRVTNALLSHAAPGVIFMHNLPAIRGEEVSADVIDGPASVVYQEAVARLHIARALLLWAMHPQWNEIVSDLCPGRDEMAQD